jgi:hypothetical protein
MSGPDFDGQLTSLGRDLYREYVRLMTSAVPPLLTSSRHVCDLRRLIDEVKQLSHLVDEDVPATLRPAGSELKNHGCPRHAGGCA